MFVANLNKAQQEMLLAFANQIIDADGVLNKKETYFLEAIKSQCVSEISLGKTFSIIQTSEIFITQRDRVSLLLELISIALADGEYHREEINIIREIASELNISMEQLQNMESWVKRQFSLLKEANNLMGGE